MIDKKILNYDQKMLCAWLRMYAGSSNPEYFNAHKGDCSLELQQVPEEYSQLLMWFKKQNFESYLELGVGRGGSFLLNVMFQPNLKIAIAVDNSEYWKESQREDIDKKCKWLADEKQITIVFVPLSTDKFFDNLEGKDTEKIGCIFIDADHSYEGVKKDFDNSLKHIKNGGFIIFHDIASASCPGVQRIWKEVSSRHPVEATFVHGGNTGIGIIKIEFTSQG